MRESDQVVLRVENLTGHEIEFLHEPVGMVYPMPAHTTFDIVSPRSAQGFVHLQVGDDHIAAWMETDQASWIFESGEPHPLERYP